MPAIRLASKFFNSSWRSVNFKKCFGNYPQFFQKKRTKKFDLTILWYLRSNCFWSFFERIDIRATVFLKWMDVVTFWLVFVRFLEESEDIKKRRFEINWPLVKFGQMSNFSKALKWMNFQVFHEGIDFFFQLWILPQLTCTPFSQHQNWWREKSKASSIALKVA